MRFLASILIVTTLIAIQHELSAKEKETKMLRHVVMFKFKSDVTQKQIDEVTGAFAELPKKIDAIKDFE